MANLSRTLYGVLKPFIYAMTMTELRNQYIRMYARNVIRIAPIVTIVSNNGPANTRGSINIDGFIAGRVRFNLPGE